MAVPVNPIQLSALKEQIIPPDIVTTSKPIQTPFSEFLNSAVGALGDISDMERNTNQLTADYVQGRASLEEVMFQTNKFNISMQLAVTVVNSSVQTLKELQQLQI